MDVNTEMGYVEIAMREKAAYADASSKRPGNREDQTRFWEGNSAAWTQAAEMVHEAMVRVNAKDSVEPLIPELLPQEFTIGEMMDPAVAIFKTGDKQMAEQYLAAHEQYLVERGTDPADAGDIARINVWYWAGYQDVETMKGMREFYEVGPRGRAESLTG